MLNTQQLQHKIPDAHFRQMIVAHSAAFSDAEIALLNEIMTQFEFDVLQTQALAQAVMQQSRFDPNALHMDDDDEDTTAICPHCLVPPVPPLRDYYVWREQCS